MLNFFKFLGGTIAAFAIALAVTFIVCAVKYNRRYKSFDLLGGAGGMRYHKRRIQRPWLASSSRSHRGLLGNHGGDLVQDESEEEEVLMENDAFSARENRNLRKENANSFIKMLHSPPGTISIKNPSSLARA